MQWTKFKKILESYICDSLKDRVKLFFTNYRNAHDGYGRASILVDDKEIINMCFYKHQNETYKLQKDLEDITNKSPQKAQEVAWEILKKKDIYADWDFFESMNEYLSLSIENATNSNNPIIKAYSMIDRRLGKRKLEKIIITNRDTDLVKLLYKLRCDVEGINYKIES